MKKHLTFAFALLTLICTSTHAQLPSYLPADGLMAWWPFNGNANDESGNGNHGNVYGATSTSNRFGLANSAMSFNGSNNYISVPYSNTIGVQQEITVSFWVYFNGGSCGPRIMQSMPWGQCGGYTIATNSSSNSSRYFYTNFDNCSVGVLSSSSPTISGLSWKHVVWSASGLTGISTMYFDGVLVDTDVTNSFFSSVNYFNRPLTIGNIDPNSCDWFGGFLDDIAIYNRALTEQEIQNLFTATNTGNTVDTGDGAAPLPQGIPYQAAARDGNGQPVVDSPVNVRFSLREGAADGVTSYIESHNLTTNSIGLFNTVFGNGTPLQSSFDSINWAATTKFLQVEVDLGSGYVDMGTTQLLSVPYAFRSAQAANIKNAALPIYPDNTAALAGGLVAGEMYRTATGDLKIVY